MATKDNLYFINSFQFHHTTYELSFQDMKALSCQFHQARSNVEKSNYYFFLIAQRISAYMLFKQVH